LNVAYTAGLLHASGMVAIDLWASEHDASLRLQYHNLPDEGTADEKHRIGFSNAIVAATLLKMWGFSWAVTEPVRWQYDPRYAGAHTNMACALHIAKWLRDAVHLADDAPPPPLPQEFALEHLRLTPDDLAIFRTEVKEAWDQAVLLLDHPPEIGNV
jgi:HD-like signal output (HDOD) protein